MAKRSKLSKTTIKRDKYGLYVRVNGHIYRPVISVYCQGMGCVSYSLLHEHDVVKARHVPQTPTAVVKTEALHERWSLHGSGRKPEECWKPPLEAIYGTKGRN